MEENEDIALQLGKLASALEARNDIDRQIFKKMEECEKRMERMLNEQRKSYHKLIWGLNLSILVLAGVNVAQLIGII